MVNKVLALFLLAIIPLCSSLYSQSDTLIYESEEVLISAPRLQSSFLNSTRSTDELHLDSANLFLANNSLTEVLSLSAGVLATNATNYAQDLRLSIRGFGSRSAFGIRGVKVIVDGIPETTPDGQTQVDNIAPLGISSLFISRSPSASLYGNASGGVIYISSFDNRNKNFLDIKSQLGEYNTASFLLEGRRLITSKTKVDFQGNFFSTDGYRSHSATKNYGMTSRIQHQLGYHNFSILSNLSYSPLAQDPGGITLSDIQLDREAARAQNVAFDSGEKVLQAKHGVTYSFQKKHLRFNTSAFHIYRQFDGRLPFENGGIDLLRNYTGHSSTLENTFKTPSSVIKSMVGYDLAFQSDKRRRFNLKEESLILSNALEQYTTIAIFIKNTFNWKRWIVEGELRYDQPRITNETEVIKQNQSFHAINYGFGVNRKLNVKSSLYTRFSTAFETPTLNELTNNPDGSFTFNPDLTPQNSLNFEFGWKWLSKNIHSQISLFGILTDNEILPFEQDGSGVRFFKNAGKTQRLGFESSLRWKIKEWASFNFNYSFSDMTYSNGEHKGKFIEGIPAHIGGLWATLHPIKRLTTSLQWNVTSDIYLTSSNEVKTGPYSRLDVNIGYDANLGKLFMKIFGGIQNLLAIDNYDNIRTNAFGGRYYEIAPPRYTYVGLSFHI